MNREILSPGSLIAGRYTIVEHLASGGMADVYVALQAPLDRRVAIKVLRLDGGDDDAVAARFHQEAVALSRLTHPNTITIFDFGTTEDGRFFLVMELLDGEPLVDRLARQRTLAVRDAVDVAVQVARSLSEAHALGIVHRDLKPDNIFLGRVEHNLVKVLDFGIATGLTLAASAHQSAQPQGPRGRLTRAGMVPGTPEYMSPEHAQGHDLDGRSDLYSLGVVLYEMLTGQVPFDGPTPVSIVLQHVNEPPPRLDASFGPGLVSFVSRTLAKNPGGRPANAQAFVDELLAAVDGGGQVSATHARRHSMPAAPAVTRHPPAPAPPPAAEVAATTVMPSVAQPPTRAPQPPTRAPAPPTRAPEPPTRAPQRAPQPASQRPAASPQPAAAPTRSLRTPDEVFMAFAEPVLERLGDRPRAPALKRNLEFASSAWNAVVDGPAALSESRQWLSRHGTSEMVHAFETLVSRKEREFAGHQFKIDGVEVETTFEGEVRAQIVLE